jgi:transposase
VARSTSGLIEVVTRLPCHSKMAGMTKPLVLKDPGGPKANTEWHCSTAARHPGSGGLVAGAGGHRQPAGQTGGPHGRKSGRPGQGGSKLYLATDAQGLPLAMAVTAANVNDSRLFEALLDDLPAIRTPSGQRRSRPGKVCADKGYDHRRCHRYLARRRIASRIARRGVESSERLGRYRWRVWNGRWRGLAATGG